MGDISLGVLFLWLAPGRWGVGWVMFMGCWCCICGLVSVYPDSGVVDMALLRGGGSFTLFSSLGVLVQRSVILWPYLSLGMTLFLVMGPHIWKGVWSGEDGLIYYCPRIFSFFLIFGGIGP